MRSTFRQSMARLHTWAGLLPGWLLFIIFFFGTASVFDEEITAWMKPELRSGIVSSVALTAIDNVIHDKSPGSSEISILLPNARGRPLSVLWEPRSPSSATTGRLNLDPSTGQAIQPRGTLGGDFLYALHFELYGLPGWLSDFLVASATLFMLTAILSGIVTQKKIFADFFLLRFGKGQRSWLEAHNVTGVLALPFLLMITYTGSVLFLFTLMPWAVSANFPNYQALSTAARPDAPKIEASSKPAPLMPLGRLIEHAQALWKGDQPNYVRITNPGDAAAVADIYLTTHLGPDAPPLRLSAVTGAIVASEPADQGATAVQDVMDHLHEARFAGPVLRWLYFVSGVAGTAMIASGLVLWTVKRRRKLANPARPHVGFWLVERLNIGVIAGAPAATATYFLANRLLPVDLLRRADWEINSFFIVWGALFVWTLARPAKRAWAEALSACAALYLLVSIINFLTTTRGLVPSLIASDWVFAGFDLVMLAAAGLFAVSAWKVATHRPRATVGLAEALVSRRMEAAE